MTQPQFCCQTDGEIHGLIAWMSHKFDEIYLGDSLYCPCDILGRLRAHPVPRGEWTLRVTPRTSERQIAFETGMRNVAYDTTPSLRR